MLARWSSPVKEAGKGERWVSSSAAMQQPSLKEAGESFTKEWSCSYNQQLSTGDEGGRRCWRKIYQRSNQGWACHWTKLADNLVKTGMWSWSLHFVATEDTKAQVLWLIIGTLYTCPTHPKLRGRVKHTKQWWIITVTSKAAEAQVTWSQSVHICWFPHLPNPIIPMGAKWHWLLI